MRLVLVMMFAIVGCGSGPIPNCPYYPQSFPLCTNGHTECYPGGYSPFTCALCDAGSLHGCQFVSTTAKVEMLLVCVAQCSDCQSVDPQFSQACFNP